MYHVDFLRFNCDCSQTVSSCNKLLLHVLVYSFEIIRDCFFKFLVSPWADLNKLG